MNNDKRSVKKVFFNTVKGFGGMMPVLIGIVFLIGLFDAGVSEATMKRVFSGGVLDMPFGVAFGTVMAGHALNSVIIGEELFVSGVSLMTVAAFMISWVTIGFSHIAMEAVALGKRFAVYRTVLSIIFAMLISYLTVVTLEVIR